MNAAMDTTTEESKVKVDNRPWVERYRPVNLDAVSHQSHVVSVLKNAVATGRLPHLLLYGPPGSGKVRYGSDLSLSVLFGSNSCSQSSLRRPQLPWHFVVNSGVRPNGNDVSWNSMLPMNVGFLLYERRSSSLLPFPYPKHLRKAPSPSSPKTRRTARTTPRKNPRRHTPTRRSKSLSSTKLILSRRTPNPRSVGSLKRRRTQHVSS